eukprot:scaffold24048_cov194-Amphora_coffeaeformis.AAC.9
MSYHGGLFNVMKRDGIGCTTSRPQLDGPFPIVIGVPILGLTRTGGLPMQMRAGGKGVKAFPSRGVAGIRQTHVENFT